MTFEEFLDGNYPLWRVADPRSDVASLVDPLHDAYEAGAQEARRELAELRAEVQQEIHIGVEGTRYSQDYIWWKSGLGGVAVATHPAMARALREEKPS